MHIFYLLSLITHSSADCTFKSQYNASNSVYPFSLASLPYNTTDFLSSFISQRIVTLHYGTHTLGYLTKLNAFIALNSKYNGTSLSALATLGSSSTSLQNYAGGLYNHYLYFWTMTAKNCSSAAPTGTLLNDINSVWGNFTNFQAAFQTAANGVFGNGWAWLCSGANGLQISTTGFQQNPLMFSGTSICYPILGIDLWEHAYYLQYFAGRSSYVSGFWSVVDWNVVGTFYQAYALNAAAVPF